MEIKVRSLKFDADQKLQAFIEKKVSKLERFYEGADSEVTLSLGPKPENKTVKLTVFAPGQKFVIERSSASFENAIEAAADAMKEKLTRAKEKRDEIQ